MYEALQVFGLCMLDGPQGNHRLGPTVMDTARRKHRDPPVTVLIVVPSEEGPSEAGGRSELREAAGEAGVMPERLEIGL